MEAQGGQQVPIEAQPEPQEEPAQSSQDNAQYYDEIPLSAELQEVLFT